GVLQGHLGVQIGLVGGIHGVGVVLQGVVGAVEGGPVLGLGGVVGRLSLLQRPFSGGLLGLGAVPGGLAQGQGQRGLGLLVLRLVEGLLGGVLLHNCGIQLVFRCLSGVNLLCQDGDLLLRLIELLLRLAHPRLGFAIAGLGLLRLRPGVVVGVLGGVIGVLGGGQGPLCPLK